MYLSMFFTLPISSWFALFRETGFEVVDYLELQAPADLEVSPFHASAKWGKQWPHEHVWKLRKRDDHTAFSARSRPSSTRSSPNSNSG